MRIVNATNGISLEGPPGRRIGRRWRHAALACCAVVMASWPASSAAAGLGTVGQGRQSPAAELTEQGAELIAEQKLEEAVDVLDRAIEADAKYGLAYYQRGRALANLGRMEEAEESLLQATRLRPGFAHAHLLASLAAENLEDYETAWDQAARAIIAGTEPGEFGSLHQASPAPPEIMERLDGWKVFVVGVDARDLLAGDQQPQNARGGVSDIRSTLGQVQGDLNELQRLLANAISDTPGFGLVPDAEMARYLLVITPETVEANPRATMEGELRLYDAESQDVAFVRRASFRNLSAESAVQVEIERFIDLLENWKRERQ